MGLHRCFIALVLIIFIRAVGIKMTVRTMERAAFLSALNAKKLRGVCVCASGRYGNIATRLAETVVSDGATAYGRPPWKRCASSRREPNHL